MYKKLLLLCSMFVFIFSLSPISAFADDSTKQIDLKTAVSTSLSKNMDLSLLNERIDIAEDKSHEKTDDATEARNEKDLEDLKWELEDTKKNIEIETTRLYHQILILQKQVALKKDIIDTLNKEYVSKKKEIEVGRDVMSSLITCEMNISTAQSELIDLENERDNAIMDLNIEMGDDIDQKLVLSEENIPDETLDIKDINEIADKLPELSHSVMSIVEERKIVHEQYDDATEYQEDAYKDQLISLQYDIDDEKKNVELKVLSDYNDLLNSKDALEAKRLDYEYDSKLSDASKVKYDNGLITILEYEKSNQNAESAQNAYLQSKLDYCIKLMNYKKFIEPALN